MAARIIASECYARYMEAARSYCSYPPITRYRAGFDEAAYRAGAARSNDDLVPRSLAVYVHIPFCARGCFYCTRPKVVAEDVGDRGAYLRAITQELLLQSALFDRDREVEYIHWMGCTAAALRNGGLEMIHSTLRHNYGSGNAAPPDCGVELDPREVNPELMAELGRQGFNRISLGAQQFGAASLRATNQALASESVAAAVAAARDTDMKSVTAELVCGVPGQAASEFLAATERLLMLTPERIAIHGHEEGLPASDANTAPSAHEHAAQFCQAAERIVDSGYIHLGRGCFARPHDALGRAFGAGTLQFGYYGYYADTRRDLIGAGLGAISEVDAVAAQHYTEPADYHSALSRGRLPVARGLQLTDEDLLRRETIEGLMCRPRLVYRPLEERYGITFTQFFAEELARLQPLREDGLIEWDGGALRITPEGRFVVPAICSVFEPPHPRSARLARFPRVL